MYKSLNVMAAGWKKKYIKQAKREKISVSGGGWRARVEGWVLVEGCREGRGAEGALSYAHGAGRAQLSGGNLRCFSGFNSLREAALSWRQIK